jgi:hypothetical protein
VFSTDDLDEAAAAVVDAWRTGEGGDWSAPAGTVGWSCARTADHAVDSVHAVALSLAARRTDGYPEWWGPLTMGPDPQPRDLVDGIAAAARLLSAVVATTEPSVRATIWLRPRVEVRGPGDFPAEGALELLLHGHDVAAGLGVPLAPPSGPCERLLAHTAGWPHWRAPGWSEPQPGSGDPWAELLRAAGRTS